VVCVVQFGSTVKALLALVFGLLTGFLIWRASTNSPLHIPSSERIYAYDSVLQPPIPAWAQLAENQRLGLVVGLSHYDHVPSYLGVLHEKYSGMGLKVVTVLEPQGPLISELQNLSIPHVVESGQSFESFLGFSSKHKHSALLMYDDSYKVKFHSLAIPDNDLLRQLVEKYLLGVISYGAPQILGVALKGQPLDGLQCYAEGKSALLAGGVFVVLPPGCSSCRLNSYRSRIAAARVKLETSRARARPWFLVFSGARDSNALFIGKGLGFDEGHICGASKSAVFDPYQTRAGVEDEPVLIEVDSLLRVSRVNQLPPLRGAR